MLGRDPVARGASTNPCGWIAATSPQRTPGLSAVARFQTRTESPKRSRLGENSLATLGLGRRTMGHAGPPPRDSLGLPGAPRDLHWEFLLGETRITDDRPCDRPIRRRHRLAFRLCLLDRRATPPDSPNECRERTGFRSQDPKRYSAHGPENDRWPTNTRIDKISPVPEDCKGPAHDGKSPPPQPIPAPVMGGERGNR